MSKAKFIREWIGVNLLGWIISDIICSIIYQRYELFWYEKNPELKIVLWSLLCVGLASIQWFRLKLKDWRIQIIPWILVTSIGWGTSVSLIGWFLYVDIPWHSPYWLSLLTYPVGIFISGLIIGAIQMIAIRNSITKPNLWILANGFGLLASGLSIIGIFVGGESIIRFYSYDPYRFDRGDRFMLSLFIWVILPLIGTITTAIPTGIILFKFRQSASVYKGFAENLVNQQPKAGYR